MDKLMIKHKRILITGGAGFIGSNLCQVLLDQGNEVVCLDNFATGYRANITSFLSNKAFFLLEGDIRNYSVCQEAVDQCDYVLHHAALGSVPRSIEDPVNSVDVNVMGFVNVLNAAVKAGVKRFIYAASSSTYGDHQGLPKVEHVIGSPMSPYAITKYSNEVFANNFSSLYGIETIGLRYFNVFGQNQSPGGAYAAVIPKFVIQLMKHESPLINCDGSFSRDFTYIKNVLQANQLAIVTPSEVFREKQAQYYSTQGIQNPNKTPQHTISEVFNVACGASTSLNDLIGILKENLCRFDPDVEQVNPIYGPGRIGDIPHSLASIEKIKQILNYAPEYPVRAGLEEVTKWYWDNYKA